MKYKPYSIEWTRNRALQDILEEYLEDENVTPEQIGKEIIDILQNWTDNYSDKVEKGKVLKSFFKNND